MKFLGLLKKSLISIDHYIPKKCFIATPTQISGHATDPKFSEECYKFENTKQMR